jgi:hypothetical protein
MSSVEQESNDDRIDHKERVVSQHKHVYVNKDKY